MVRISNPPESLLNLVSPSRQIRALLTPFFALAAETSAMEASCVHPSRESGGAFCMPRVVCRGAETFAAEPLKLAVFALIHGDEPAGAAALFQLLQAVAGAPQLLRGVDLFCYPLCNPSGFEDGTRTNRAGADLNREFWNHSIYPEVQALEEELRAEQFDGLVALHADFDSPGLYAFARGPMTSEELLAPALAAASAILPRNTDVIIDGFVAEHGIIRDCYSGVLSPPPEQTPAPFEIILETPGQVSIEVQARAAYHALRGLIAELPRLSIGGAGI